MFCLSICLLTCLPCENIDHNKQIKDKHFEQTHRPPWLSLWAAYQPFFYKAETSRTGQVWGTVFLTWLSLLQKYAWVLAWAWVRSSQRDLHTHHQSRLLLLLSSPRTSAPAWRFKMALSWSHKGEKDTATFKAPRCLPGISIFISWYMTILYNKYYIIIVL